MRAGRQMKVVLAGALLAGVGLVGTGPGMAATAADAEDSLSAAALRGRVVYHQGAGSRGAPRVARVGEHDIELPAASLPCASCHGADGLGRPESGIYPSRLDWGYLAQPDGHRHPATGRRHPPFDEPALKAALVAGIDPAGNRLDPIMPRYDLDDEDIADLVAYLREMGRDLDPGVSGARVRIATVLPGDGPLAALGESVAAVLRARFEALNAAGGLHGRTVELHVAAVGASSAEALEMARALAADATMFALLAVVAPGEEQALAELARTTGVPVVAPVTISSPPGEQLGGPVFFLYPDLVQQSVALLRHARAEHGAAAKLQLLAPDERLERRALAAARATGWETPLALGCPRNEMQFAALATRLAASEGPVLYLCGPGALTALLKRVEAAGAAHTWLAPGQFGDAGLFGLVVAQRARVRLALPSTPADLQGSRGESFLQLVDALQLDPRFLQAQMSAYAGAELVIEGLRLSGRALTRARFVDGLESVAGLQTGVSPPLSFRGGQRIGAAGAYVAQPQDTPGRYLQLGDWINGHY